jgi:hypothetical protein
MTSILKVDNLQDSSGTGTPYIKDAVLQVKQGVLQTNWASGASTDWQDTPLTVTITPKSTSSNILITAMISYSLGDGDHGGFKVVRNDTDFLLTTETLGNRVASHTHSHMAANTDTDYQIQNATINLLDSPSSTSALIYKLQGRTKHDITSRIYLNHLGLRTEDQVYQAYCISTITAMEIGG